METTRNVSFHNTVKEEKARVIRLLLKVLSAIPAATLLLLFLVGLINYGHGDNSITKALWLSSIMLFITVLQFAIRYIYDQSFEMKGRILLSAIVGIIWFFSWVNCL
jgi:hypothetical protein